MTAIYGAKLQGYSTWTGGLGLGLGLGKEMH